MEIHREVFKNTAPAKKNDVSVLKSESKLSCISNQREGDQRGTVQGEWDLYNLRGSAPTSEQIHVYQ